MPINGKSVSENTFGTDVTNPKFKKGTMEAVGHTVHDGGQPIPQANRDTSVNVQSGMIQREGTK